jgi:hypothetical protein
MEPLALQEEYRKAVGGGEKMLELIVRTVALRSSMALPHPPGRLLPPRFYGELAEEWRNS